MNVSKEHLMVLLLAKNSGERFYADFFGNFSFFRENKALNQKNLSINLVKYQEIEDYGKIACLDNPYRIVYQEFLLNSSENWKLKVNTIEKQKAEFTHWFDNIFYNDFDYLEHNCAKHQINFLFSKDFSTMNIDYVIKKESYLEDLQKIPFIDISKINPNLDFLVKPTLDYQKILTKAQAKKIFDFFKPYFIKFHYDPFSFTTEELTVKEKVDFIHS